MAPCFFALRECRYGTLSITTFGVGWVLGAHTNAKMVCIEFYFKNSGLCHLGRVSFLCVSFSES